VSGAEEGRVAFITGGARGIGLAIAQRLGGAGLAIAIADLDGPAGSAAVETLAGLGIRTASFVCNAADEDSVTAAVAAASVAFGGIDVLVNNAGKHLLEYAVPPTSLPREKWRVMLELNVIGVVNCAAACRASMRERGGGVIVNIGSTAGLVGNTAYGVSKLAVRGLTVGLAQELAADGIRVCGVAPGLVDSPAAQAEMPAERREDFVNNLQLVKRAGRMEDVAAAVQFLCSADAAFITGETLTVSGGYPLHL
jgi:3-oxoacyl-[acyl-carrier protein] reductase